MFMEALFDVNRYLEKSPDELLHAPLTANNVATLPGERCLLFHVLILVFVSVSGSVFW